MPATNKRSPSVAGVDRIQLPFFRAKKGTLIDPSQSVAHFCSPVARSKARTASFSSFTDSVV